MINKVYNSTIISGITLSYLILGFSNHELYLDNQQDVRLLDSIGFSLFQVSHLLLFTRIYLSNKTEKFNFLLLIPIIVQLIDLVPIELLHSVKFNLISILSIIIGWITVIFKTEVRYQRKLTLPILIGIACLLIRLTPSLTLLYSIDEPRNAIYQFGLELNRFDRLNLFGKSGIIYQSISDSFYVLVIVFLALRYPFRLVRDQIS